MTPFRETPVIVDAFDAPESWMAVASGLAELKIGAKQGRSGHALRLSFDFHGGGGFVVARKELALSLSADWEFRFRLRGELPPNQFEFKLISPDGASVWRWKQDVLTVDGRWKEFSIPCSAMPFAWGPAGGGLPVEIGAIEFVIAAGEGGAGNLWIDHFEWVDLGPRLPESVKPTSGIADGLLSGAAGWQSAATDRKPCLEFDFGRKRELGGVILHWKPGGERDVTLETRQGGRWRPTLELRHVGGPSTPIPLLHPPLRHLRLRFKPGAGLEKIEWKGPEFASSDDEFLHTMAAESPEGAFPKYWLRRQTLLTPAGSPVGGPRAMVNEEGLIETDEAGFSLEPFLHDEDGLKSWAQVEITRSLEKGWMPLPVVRWETGPLALTITARSGLATTGRALVACYELENRSSAPRSVRLHIVVRPFQATPPWQRHGLLGGKSPITAIGFEGSICRVNQTRAVVALDPPSHVGAQPFAAGRLFQRLAANTPPEEVDIVDPLGSAEAVFTFDLNLAPGERSTRTFLIPFGTVERRQTIEAVECSAGKAREEWRAALGGTRFDVPPTWNDAAETWRAAAAHILVNRERFALHPGPRRYNRAWIRDGVVMGAALARAGDLRAFTDFIDWYGLWNREDGLVPCCVDRNGADWLIEYDSLGQWLYGIAECHRFGAGDAFALAHWPAVMRCVSHIRELRERRPDEGYDLPDKRPFRGLLPESASHEGYLAHPVHAYWDDFWAIRGLRDAHALAVGLERPPAECHIIAALRDALTHSVETSLRATMELRKIGYIPGSVEWADFDPSATAVALMLLDGLDVLPKSGLTETFDRYMQGFRDRFFGNQPWTNYSAYEMRVVTALTRLGRRSEAHAVLRFLLDDRRPQEWRQWPEITWKSRQSPGHFGDLPHSWIGAEYVLGFAGLFAYERESDDSLVLAAGLPDDWFDHGRTNGVTGLPTYYGRLSYSLERGKNGWSIDIAPLERSPRGGIDVRLPVSAAGGLLLASGREHRIGSDGSVRLFDV
jgi:hypothetical protein